MTPLLYAGKKLLLLTSFLGTTYAGSAQIKYQATDNIHSSVSGTSTLHDWNMKTSAGQCKATFTLNASNELTDLTNLSLSIPAASLKSKSKSMDKNAYKALKTKDNKSITFDLISATLSANGTITCMGTLSIAGKSINTQLIAVAKSNANKTIGITGSKKISMKEFNMVPPTFMLGTIKTGNDITLSFDLILEKI
jgi:polyisoprenoid-binding protein YceI